MCNEKEKKEMFLKVLNKDSSNTFVKTNMIKGVVQLQLLLIKRKIVKNEEEKVKVEVEALCEKIEVLKKKQICLNF